MFQNRIKTRQKKSKPLVKSFTFITDGAFLKHSMATIFCILLNFQWELVSSVLFSLHLLTESIFLCVLETRRERALSFRILERRRQAPEYMWESYGEICHWEGRFNARIEGYGSSACKADASGEVANWIELYRQKHQKAHFMFRCLFIRN